MAHTLPDLPYAIDALAPYMSQETLEFHHGKHHNTYVTNLNNLVAGNEFESMSLEDIVKKTYNVADKAGVFNNASQHWNHILFWQCMKPQGGSNIPGELEKRIVDSFGNVDEFKGQFTAKAAGQFGSGWAWLVHKDGKLSIEKTANAETPLTGGGTPLLTIDVWEHAYYIDYQNRRPAYTDAVVMNLLNWHFAAENLG